MNKELTKKILIYAGIVLFFIVLSYGFVPQVLGGKIVNQSDIASWKGMANEAMTYNAAHPEDPTAWTNSMFGGMPTTAMIDDFEGDWTQNIYKFLLLGRRPATYLFLTLLGAFLLMMSMGINGILAVAGAIAVAFCSYNMQIIQVGHNTKMQAIAYFPWVLAAMIFTYKSALRDLTRNGTKGNGDEDGRKGHCWKEWLPKTVLGTVLFALALSMQIKANHVQITYYLAIVIFVYAISLFISLCMDKDRKEKSVRFFAASGLLLVVGIIGIATNANKLIPTYEYTPYTMRGGSELSASSDTHNAKGLDLAYATAWSYGIEEMPNLLIPNFNGGSSSGPLDTDSETGKLLKRAGQPRLKETMKHMPLYWGPQPFTAGPMYMGAISIFLFVLGICLIKGREKWWIVIATLIAVLLSWGNHFMWFTRLWFDYAPFYNKFRTVSMSLTVLQVTVPLLGFLVLDRIVKEKYEKKEFMKAGYIAYALTAGFCLLCVLIPGIAGTYTGASDAGQPDILVDALISDRQALMRKDALRSLVLITVVFALILWAFRTPKVDAVGKNGSFVRKGRMSIIAVAMVVLVWLDLVSVGKRYLNKDHFVTPKDFSAHYEPRPVDEIILEDTDPDYRVLDLSVNTFNSSIPSYHHKTIGGYSPVKLQRYQDLIDRYLTSEIRSVHKVIGESATVSEVSENLPYMPVTSMLNGKYIILGGEYPPVQNPYAFGNCWFVDSVAVAATPDDEIALIGRTDLRTTAIIGDDFKWAQEAVLSDASPVMSSGVDTSADRIALTGYTPKELRYTFRTTAERAAVFSEIYYPKGWKAWVEPAGTYGQVKNGHYKPTSQAREIDLFRADWMLRGALIPEGEGELIMRFEPDSYQLGKEISRASSIVLILLLLGSVALIAVPKR
ncbi:MAG: hypothetical protein IKB85_04205 [Bacteroidales bacterium]|nr:hypothetical protein [Bacteroidales bacterium]